MKDSTPKFKDSVNKEFSKINLNPETMKDANKLLGQFNEDEIKGGLTDKMTLEDIIKKHTNKKNKDTIKDLIKSQLKMGIKVEREHTKDSKVAKEIAMDHLYEDPKYYSKLKKMETKEATGTGSSGQYSSPLFSTTNKIEATEATTSASVGAYETPAAWAKSSSKKHWRGRSKPQIPGGSFVSVKKRCKKFPYCNQGDIKALNIYENQSVKDVITSLSNKMNISETTIKAIIEYELEKKMKNK